MNVSPFPSMKKAITLPLLMFLFFLFISRSAPRASNPDIKFVTNPLSNNYSKFSRSYLRKTFNLSTSITEIKARYLKQRKYSSFSSNITVFIDGLSARIPLSFGTPPQILHFVLDTGSSITWFECNNYLGGTNNFSVFNPSLSASSKYLTCNDPKHKQFSKQKVRRCHNCEVNNSKNCLQLIDYEIHYDVGYTKGIYMSEVLRIPGQTISNFVVGCSPSSTIRSSGVVGFGRGIESLPSQTGIKRFSYCLPSIQYDNKLHKGYLILNGHFHKSKLSYTPILNSQHTQKLEHYYVVLEDIIIGPKSIRIPSKFIVPSYDGSGGTVLDSGSSLTYIESSLFEVVIQEFQTQLGKHTFIGNTPQKLPCFNISGKETSSLPKLAFQFNGGAVINLPMKNYLVNSTKNDILCFSIAPHTKTNSKWPAIILGNTLLRDFYIEFDLARNRFGFLANEC